VEKTTNYKLSKPDLGDRVSIGDINENMDILDEKLKDVDIVKIDKSKILTTKEEVEAVTEPGFLVDAQLIAQQYSDYTIAAKQASTWIDGSPVYQKVIGFTAAGNSGYNATTTIDTGTVYDKIIQIYGYATNAGNPNLIIPGKDVQVAGKADGSITITNSASTTEITGFVIIRYIQLSPPTTSRYDRLLPDTSMSTVQ